MDRQFLIERSLYESVRLKVVAEGLTPDITSIPDSPEGFDLYLEKLAEIKRTKGFAIEVFGFSPPEDKGLIQYPRIVFYSDAFVPGNVGVSQDPEYISEKLGEFTPVTHDALSYDLLFSCYLQASTTSEFRVLKTILHASFTPFSYISIVGTGYQFLCLLSGADQRDQYRDGNLESVYRYYVPDILFNSYTHNEAIKALQEFTINLSISEHLGISNI